MRKVLLDLNPAKSVEWIHEYLKFALEFDDYYGKNLDALYDQLTSVTEDTCLGVFCPPAEDRRGESSRRQSRSTILPQSHSQMTLDRSSPWNLPGGQRR